MSEFDYDRWWGLHLRVAKGETLSGQEQAEYQAGLEGFEGISAKPNGDALTYLYTLRAAINRAATLHAELEARSADLDGRISELEASYQALTGQALDLTSHGPA